MGASSTGLDVSGDNKSISKCKCKSMSTHNTTSSPLVYRPMTSTPSPSITTTSTISPYSYYSTIKNTTKNYLGASCFAKTNTKDIYALTLKTSKMQNKSATARTDCYDYEAYKAYEASKCYYYKDKSFECNNNSNINNSNGNSKEEEVSQKMQLAMSHFNQNKMNTNRKSSVPVYVMLPLDTVDANGVFRLESCHWFTRALEMLVDTNVKGVAVDIWWGAVEQLPQQYNWHGYKKLFNMIKRLKLKLQVVLSFHACGGNVGDSVQVPLPQWVLNSGKIDPDIFFSDESRENRPSHRNKECISIFADEIPGVLAGRSPLKCYADFMISFKEQFGNQLGNLISDVVIGCGPCGELRYPSYVEANGWRFPGIGEFQCYDKHALASLAKAAYAIGKPEWGYRGPHDAGNYNSTPEETPFFRGEKGSWSSAYGQFFMKWYSDSLIQHGERILAIASQVFGQGVKSTQLDIYPEIETKSELETDYMYNESYLRNPRNSDVYFTDMWVTTSSPLPSPLPSHIKSPSNKKMMSYATYFNHDEEMVKDFQFIENHFVKNTKKVSSAASLDPNTLDEDLVVLEAQTGSFSFRKVVSNDSVALNNFSEAITKDDYSNSSRGSTEEDCYDNHNHRQSNTNTNTNSLSKNDTTIINHYLYQENENNPSQHINSTNSDHGCFHPDIFKRIFAGILGSSNNNNSSISSSSCNDNNNKTSVDSCDKSVNISIKIAGIHWWYLTQSHAAELTAGYYNTNKHCGYTDIINLCNKYNANLILTCVEMCDEQHPIYAHCSPQGLLHQIQMTASKLGVRLSGENALPIFYGISGGIDVDGLRRIVKNTKNQLMCQNQEEERQILKLGQNTKTNIYKNGSYPSMLLFTFLRLGPEMVYNDIHQDLWKKFMVEMQT